MPQFLKFILYALLPSSFINSYICVRFCTGILTPSRSFFSKNRIRFFLSFMIPMTAAGMSKYWFPSMGSWLIQLTLLLMTVFYFSDPLKKKISTFLILICILAVSENIAVMFTLPIYTLIHHGKSFRYNLLYTSGEMLFLMTIDFFVALLFIKKLVPLIRDYSHSIHLTTIAELLFPVQASSLLMGILLYRENSPWLKWLIILYWFLNLLCCLIIARAFHNISVREKRHELLIQQMSFLQKQLEYTTEMEQEYQSVRKWNHDMENHLFSLNYLIRTQKYPEADVYLETILSELPPEKRTL